MTTTSEQTKPKKTLRLGISIQGFRNAICVGKDVIHALGEPTHICLRINEDYSSLAISPCEPNEVLSFKVPERIFVDRHVVCRIHSKQFVKGLLSTNGLESEKTYAIKGSYSPQNNTAVFDFADLVPNDNA